MKKKLKDDKNLLIRLPLQYKNKTEPEPINILVHLGEKSSGVPQHKIILSISSCLLACLLI